MSGSVTDISMTSHSGDAPEAPSPYTTWQLLRRVWDIYLKHARKRIALILGLIVIVAATTSLYPILINWVFEAFEERDPSVIMLAPIAVLVVTALKSAAFYGQAFVSNTLITDLEFRLRRDLYFHLIDSDVDYLSQTSSASHASRFVTDVTYVLNAVERFIKNFVKDVLTMIALLGAMFYLDWQLTLITLVIAPFAAWPIAAIGQHLRKVARQTQARIGDMSAVVHEGLAGQRLAKTYNLEDWLKGRSLSLFDTIQGLRLSALNARARVQPTMEALGGIAVAVVIAIIGWRIVEGQNTIGQFTGFVSALLFIAQPLNGLGNLNSILQEGLSALGRIFHVLDSRPEIKDALDAKPLVVDKAAIQFEAVHFRYKGDRDILQAISLDIQPGETIALVGPSGAGKSTLVSLLPRLYDVTDGAIRIDGQPLQTVTVQSLRDQIAVVSQDAVLFHDTVAQNIAVGRLDAAREAIEEAAHHAAAHEFISALPNGYDTVLGENGGGLSGGERQRLSLARAFLKDAPILLLDEVTSALDAQSEEHIQKALKRLSEGRTTLIIAHRLSTIREADRIVVMQDGRIVEIGKHEELLSQNGLYSELYKLQFRDV
jgi:subfamily B ATP-binding cassette protein MsbA